MSTIKDGGPASIPLVCGGNAVVSDRDVAMVMESKWRMGMNGYIYKVGARKRGVPCLLHRIIVDARPGIDVHHRDRNKSNCQRSNLELLDPAAHQEHHKHIVIARNLASRVYSKTATCKRCGVLFEKHPSHRGRQVCCSKLCAILLAVDARKEKFRATQ